MKKQYKDDHQKWENCFDNAIKPKIISVITLLFFIFNIPLFASTITVNGYYSTDNEIYPFTNLDPIYGLNFSGHVTLDNETSLVRIILETQDGQKFMLYEAYPLITSAMSLDVNDICDETCYLNGLIPVALIIEIIDAKVEIDYLTVADNFVANAVILQKQEKRNCDLVKIEQLIANIPIYGITWIPGDNGVVEWFYNQKVQRWGEKYNLLGYDYYTGGVYEALGQSYATILYNPYVDVWDWRNRHGANDPLSPYFDQDYQGQSGWLTSVKNQFNICGACSVFGTLGSLEATINLHYNQHVDMDLSEQQLISCNPLVSCEGGLPENIFPWLLINEVVEDVWFPYIEANGDCDDIPANPPTTVAIGGFDQLENTTTWSDVQLMLLQKGPLTWVINPDHVVTLVGWRYVDANDKLYLIYKDSFGTSWGEQETGYCITTAPSTCLYVAAATEPVVNSANPPEVLLRDEDGDGYDNWGIGPKPVGSSAKDCDDSNPYMSIFSADYSCLCSDNYYPEAPVYITGNNVYWVEGQQFEHPVIIKNGGKLTINCTVFIPEQGKIIVEPGGQLVIDGGKLTKSCDKFWKGIEIWGNSQLPQINSSTPGNMFSNQGYMAIKNNGQIEYAEMGVLVGAKNAVGDFIYEKAGGVLSVHDSKFKNNINDIYFLPYYDGPYEVNHSSINRSIFETNDELLLSFIPEVHLTLNDVYGVMIKGCSFSYVYQPTIASEPENRGIGILVMDASLSVFSECLDYPAPVDPADCQNELPCTFENLRYGIKAYNTGANRLFRVNNAVFNENIEGIYLSGYNQAEVVSSIFNVAPEIPFFSIREDLFYCGIYLDECSGYHIEGNEFQGTYLLGGIPSLYKIGMYIKDSGPDDNEIYDNDFHSLSFGIIAEGINRGENTGLVLKCNTLLDNYSDILVVTDPLKSILSRSVGIKESQGSDAGLSEDLAGNTFTNWFEGIPAFGLSFWNYNNDANNFNYYHHLNQNDPLLAPYEDNYTPTTITLAEKTLIPFNRSEACPSKLEGGDLRTNMGIAENEISTFSTQLESLTDGGDTEEMNTDIVLSTPPESYDLSLQLLNASPYLSDTVMQSAIAREEVLPNAMVRDILVANPQAGKKNEILDAAENRQGMPGYMMTEIMQGQQVIGAKEVLESKLAHWNNERTKALNGLVRNFMEDTLISNPFDSLVALYQNEEKINSRYRLAFAYWDNGQPTEALDEINDIPVNFELTAFQSAIQNDYESYFNVLQNMKNDSLNPSQLSANDISILTEIMGHQLPQIGGYARGLLLKGGHISYTEDIVLPENTKSSRTYIDDRPSESEFSNQLRLMPNPANDHVIIDYDLGNEASGQGIVLIRDVKGVLYKNLGLHQSRNQITVDISNLVPGIYLVSLYDGNKLIETDQLSVSK